MKKRLLLGVVLAMSLTFAGCSATEVEQEPAVTEEETQEVTDTEETGSDIFEYELSTETLEEGGIYADYPVFINTNNEEKAAVLNASVLANLNELIGSISEGASEVGDLTISISCEYTQTNSPIVSIHYLGEYSGTDMAYPVSFYHSFALNAQNEESVVLSDLFTIDENFVNTFLAGMYTVYRDDLNLEDSEVNVADAISSIYTTDDLMNWFSSGEAPFYLGADYIVLSVPVQNAIGDHIEMSIPLERLEGNSIRDHVYWQDYGFLDGNSGDTSEDTSDESADTSAGSAADVSMAYYDNAAYGYSQIYPEIFDNMEESDDGAGVTMTSDAEGYVLLIWAEYNVNEVDGFTMMEEARNGYESITNYSGDDDSYKVEFQEGSNEDTRAGVESGYIEGDMIIHYILSYPVDSDAPFYDIVEMMENGRTYE